MCHKEQITREREKKENNANEMKGMSGIKRRANSIKKQQYHRAEL